MLNLDNANRPPSARAEPWARHITTLGTRLSATSKTKPAFTTSKTWSKWDDTRTNISRRRPRQPASATTSKTSKPRRNSGSITTSPPATRTPDRDNSFGTFNQLYPFGHYYLGYLDLVGRQNIQIEHAGRDVPHQLDHVLAQYHNFHLGKPVRRCSAEAAHRHASTRPARPAPMSATKSTCSSTST